MDGEASKRVPHTMINADPIQEDKVSKQRI